MAEPLKATFFTLKHRDRAVLLPATLVTVVMIALLVAALLAFNWAGIMRFAHLIQEGPGAKVPEAQAGLFVASIFALIGSVFLFLIPFFIILAAYEAACLRWMIRGEAPGVFGLTFNNDTWRVYGVYWCWVVAKFVVSFAVSILTMPLMFATMGEVFGHGGKPDIDAMMRWQWSVQMPLAFLQYLPLAFIGIRLGPAAATSVARDRFSFFEAWKVTRGRFFSLLGSWALLWLIFGALYVAIFAASWGFLLQDAWRDWMVNWPRPPSEESFRMVFALVFSQQGLVIYALSAAANLIVLTAYALMSYGVNARAALAALEEGKIEQVPA